jgi:RimJ/RimL family protein N-acetyltransferase
MPAPCALRHVRDGVGLQLVDELADRPPSHSLLGDRSRATRSRSRQRDVQLALELGHIVGTRVLANLSDGRIVGVIQTYMLDQMIHDRCEVGFFVGSEYRGRDYALEADSARALLSRSYERLASSVADHIPGPGCHS